MKRAPWMIGWCYWAGRLILARTLGVFAIDVVKQARPTLTAALGHSKVTCQSCPGTTGPANYDGSRQAEDGR